MIHVLSAEPKAYTIVASGMEGTTIMGAFTIQCTGQTEVMMGHG